MVGRKLINRAMSPRPMVASTNVATTEARPWSKAKPRVSSDEPDTSKARSHPSASMAQWMPAKPTSTHATHTPGSSIKANGANRAMMRSAASQSPARSIRQSNGLRRVTNTQRCSSELSARGTTTVFTADAKVAPTTAAPARKVNTRATVITGRRVLVRPDRSIRASRSWPSAGPLGPRSLSRPFGDARSGRLDPHDRVVVGHLGGRLPAVGAAGDQHVALGPVDLQRAGGEAGQRHRALEAAGVGAQPHPVPGAHPQRGGVGGVHEHGVAAGAGEGIDVALHHRVELLAPPRRHHERPLGQVWIGRLQRAEPRP